MMREQSPAATQPTREAADGGDQRATDAPCLREQGADAGDFGSTAALPLSILAVPRSEGIYQGSGERKEHPIRYLPLEPWRRF